MATTKTIKSQRTFRNRFDLGYTLVLKCVLADWISRVHGCFLCSCFPLNMSHIRAATQKKRSEQNPKKNDYETARSGCSQICCANFFWLMIFGNSFAYQSITSLINKHNIYYLQFCQLTLLYIGWFTLSEQVGIQAHFDSTHAYWWMYNGCWKDRLDDLSFSRQTLQPQGLSTTATSINLGRRISGSVSNQKCKGSKRLAAPHALPGTCDAVSNVFQ